MDLKKLVREYLQEAKLMQVVTSVSNQPWACSVYFAFDEQMNLYWISKPSSRHSQEIRENEKVAGTIVLPHTPGDKVRGISFQGVAKELTDKNVVEKAMSYYAKRFNMSQERVNAIISNKDGHLCYKITPNQFVLFDELNFPEQSRQELNM